MDKPWLLLHHCGWCQPLPRWAQWLYPLGVRWSTGICPECLAAELAGRAVPQRCLLEHRRLA